MALGSSYHWAGVLNPNAIPLCASDYWSGEILSSDIAVKEALALSNALSSFTLTIKDSRVDVYVDSSALFHACSMPVLKMFDDFLPGKIPEGKWRSMLPVVLT